MHSQKRKLSGHYGIVYLTGVLRSAWMLTETDADTGLLTVLDAA